MRCFIITPFSRPEFISNVLDNFRCQNYPKKTLILVENGPAIGTFPRNTGENIVVLESEHHQSIARNQALDWIKENYVGPHSCWLNQDDDDRYGPSYCPEAVWFMRQYPDHITGKRRHWVQTKTMGTFLYRHPQNNYLHGATLGSCSFEHRYPTDVAIGEDFKLVNLFGDKTVSSSINHYVWIRRDYGRAHTFSGNDYLIYHTGRIKDSVSNELYKQVQGSPFLFPR